MNLASDLKKIVTGDVHDDNAALERAKRDASLLEVRPQVVVAVRNADDVKALVQYASEHEGVNLTARSGATGMDGGALGESIIVDFNAYMTRVGEVDEAHAIVEPGCLYRNFEPETLKYNRIMPSYPASREICTVGGMVANNSGGEKTLVYGKTEDYLNHLKVVLADGNEYYIYPMGRDELEQKKAQDNFEGQVYRDMHQLIEDNYDAIKAAKPNVSKNSAGYYLWNVWDRDTGIFDFTQLFVGSQGTLGLITEINFKLVEPLPESQMLIMYIDDMSKVGDIVQTVLKHKPATFESYDDKTLKLALRFAFEFVKRLGFQNIFTLIVNGIPEALSIMRHGLPQLVLQVTFDGHDKAELKSQAQACAADLEQFSPRYMEVIRSPREADEYWLVRRESFNLLRHKVQGKKTAPFIDDIVVNPGHLPEFLPRLGRLLDEYSDYMIHNIAGHIGNGNFHIIPLMDFTDAEARNKIPEIAKRTYDLVLEYGGSTTGEHNDGLVRTPFVRQMYGDDVYALFEQTKNIFDPKGIFNPRKKVGATIDYMVEHIKKENV